MDDFAQQTDGGGGGGGGPHAEYTPLHIDTSQPAAGAIMDSSPTTSDGSTSAPRHLVLFARAGKAGRTRIFYRLFHSIGKYC